MDNPYQSPGALPGSWDLTEPSRQRRGLVHHVRVLAILMIVQAALELLAAAGLGATAVSFVVLFKQVQAEPPMNEAAMLRIMPFVYAGMAVAALLCGVLRLTAGVRNYRFRGRTLGIASLACGALTVLTCYCLPTAAALAVYGLIVYLNREVADAFRMGEAGHSPAQILATFQG